MTITSLCRPNILISPCNLIITNPKNSNMVQNVYRNSFKYKRILTNNCYSKERGHKFSEFELESSKILHTSNDEQYSWLGLEREAMPKHIAIALDGNRRWLKAHGRDLDYKPFFDKNIEFAQFCLNWGIPVATAFMWGLSNFSQRGEEQNELFLGQFQNFMEDNLEYVKRNGIKVRAVGETKLLSKSIQETIEKVEEATKNNSNLELSLPICYTGQRDITNATRRICEKVKQGVIEPSDITEHTIENELSITSSPVPDLFIRTGGELRIGALLTWQISHIELYFTDVMAPDFGEDVFLDALRSFQQRNRKFGK